MARVALIPSFALAAGVGCGPPPEARRPGPVDSLARLGDSVRTADSLAYAAHQAFAGDSLWTRLRDASTRCFTVTLAPAPDTPPYTWRIALDTTPYAHPNRRVRLRQPASRLWTHTQFDPLSGRRWAYWSVDRGQRWEARGDEIVVFPPGGLGGLHIVAGRPDSAGVRRGAAYFGSDAVPSPPSAPFAAEWRPVSCPTLARAPLNPPAT